VFDQADYIVMESTYGDRDHPPHEDRERQLEQVICETIGRNGNLVVPTFAIERAQELMYFIHRLSNASRIPKVPVFLDSPMAVHATAIFDKHRECYDEETWRMLDAGDQPLRFPGLKLVKTVEDSKAINALRGPAIIMAPSGMCTAGRIKHHLAHNITRPECTILFTGYQGRGTLGREILEGQREVRIHGRAWPVKAQIAEIHGFSGHADRTGLLRWLDALRSPPCHLFLVHGEEQSALHLADQIRREKSWPVTVPQFQEQTELP
jgi:metallo-beta-lactamase family protein